MFSTTVNQFNSIETSTTAQNNYHTLIHESKSESLKLK